MSTCDLCGDIEHKEVFLHARCHISAPAWVKMIDGGEHDDVFVVSCVSCDREICRIRGAVISAPTV